MTSAQRPDGGALPGLPGLSFHHVGLACRDLAKEAAAHALLGFAPEGGEFEDPHQRVRGSFHVLGPFRVELLEPIDEQSPLMDWLARGVKMYHVCYETDDLDGALAQLRAAGHRTVSAPAPAVAFDHRPVAFVMLRTRSLVELLQR
ncbi:VOC family protein [Geodermatophilus sp. URMC 64]